MTVENATYLHQLNSSFPRADDIISEGDDHIRLLKRVLASTFPGLTGPVNTTSTILNALGSLIAMDGGTAVFKLPLKMDTNKTIDAGNNRIMNVANPSVNSDAATKGWAEGKFASNALTINGHELNTNITLSKSDVGLGSVPNNAGTAEATADTLVLRDSTGKSKFVDVYISSDRRLKSNFEKLENAVDKVNALTGYEYDKETGAGTVREAGVIAQEVQAVLPHSVSESDGILHVSHAGLVALLVEAVKELSAEVKALKGE